MKSTPPNRALKFLRWFCREDYLEEIEGDLFEIFEMQSEESPKKANRRFTWSVIRYFRPAFIKSFRYTNQINTIDMFQYYFKTGWRSLIKNHKYSLINIGGLGLAFGCTILIYLFINHHLHYDNFHANSDRIYRFVTEEHRDDIDYEASVPPGFAYSFKHDYDYAEKLTRVVSWQNQLITLGGEKKLQEDVVFVDEDFFRIFNFPLSGGQTPDSFSEPNKAIITESSAVKFFGNADPLGKTFQLEGKEIFTVVEVLKDLPTTTLIKGEIIIPYESLKKYSGFLTRDDEWRGINSSLQCFALLRPNQDIDEIEKAISSYVPKYRPDSKNVHKYKLQPLLDIHFDGRYSGGINVNLLWIFSLIGLFLLVVASINFINISTAQTITRSKEVGVRKVLGSLRKNLYWQFISETLILAFFALLVGIALSSSALPYFNSVFGLNLSINGILDFKFLVFSCLLLFGISMLAGSYPGVLLSRVVPVLALKGKFTSKGNRRFSMRQALVVTQFVISMVLIIGTVVINKQIKFATDSDLGFEKTGIVRIPFPHTLEREKVEILKNKIMQFSGIEKLTACYASPGAPDNSWGTNVRYNNRPEDESFSIQTKIGDDEYLNTFDLKLVAGRNFQPRDTVDEVLVNEMFAKKLGVDDVEELLGKAINIAGGFVQATIVGVVEDFHDQNFHDNIRPIYIAPVPSNYYELHAKINLGDTKATLAHIENEWSEYYKDFIFEYDFLDDRIEEMYKSEQQFLSLTKLFSALSIFIGCLGIYGMILFFVTQKTQEIGIRKVLGSSVIRILVLVMQDFFELVIIAGFIASPLAWYLMNNWLQNYEFRTEISWWIYLVAIVMVMVITMLTISHQAFRAARANPVNSLRSE